MTHTLPRAHIPGEALQSCYERPFILGVFSEPLPSSTQKNAYPTPVSRNRYA